MKAFFFLLFFSTFSFAKKPANHEMYLFGYCDKIFISHIPQFKAPYNYQAIFEIEMSPPTKEAYINASENIKPDLPITLITEEQIILADLPKNPKSFKVSIYEGHFNRPESSAIETNTTIKIVDTIYFKELHANDPKPKDMEYFYLGTPKKAGFGGNEFFLVRKIISPPDFNHILLVSYDPLFHEFPNKYYTFVFSGEQAPYNWKPKAKKTYNIYEASTKKQTNFTAYMDLVLEKIK